MKMRVVLLAMVLGWSEQNVEAKLSMLDVYEMYGSPISEKTSVESEVMFEHNGNVSFRESLSRRAIAATESREKMLFPC